MQDPVKFQILYLVLFLRSLELFLPQLSPLCIFLLKKSWETWFRFLHQEGPLEKGTPTHSSILAWRITWAEEPGRLLSIVAKNQTWLSNFHFHSWFKYHVSFRCTIQRLSFYIYIYIYTHTHTHTHTHIVYSFSDSLHFFHYRLYYKILRASQLAQRERIHLPMQGTQETQVWSLGQEDPLEEEMATHSSVLAWEITCTEEPGRLQFIG